MGLNTWKEQDEVKKNIMTQLNSWLANNQVTQYNIELDVSRETLVLTINKNPLNLSEYVKQN